MSDMYHVYDSLDDAPLLVKSPNPAGAAIIAERKARTVDGIDRGPIEFQVFPLEWKDSYYEPAASPVIFLSPSPGELKQVEKASDLP